MWEDIKSTIEDIYGKETFTITNDNGAYISRDGVPLAMLGVTVNNNMEYVTLSLRASLSPNDSGLIASAVVTTHRLMIVPNFELASDGNLVYGEKALDIVRGIISSSWQKREAQEMEAFGSYFCEKQKDQPN